MNRKSYKHKIGMPLAIKPLFLILLSLNIFSLSAEEISSKSGVDQSIFDLKRNIFIQK